MVYLVVVESPNKVKKIQSYLGDGYRVIATKGHFRDLPKAHPGTIPEKWVSISGKSSISALLKKECKSCEKHVILATDPDREGEAIAWHICDILKLDPLKTPRAIFHEVTKEAVCDAVSMAIMPDGPRVDMLLVGAQKARRLIDRRLGYSGTRFLWKTIGGGVSAGRCLIPAAQLLKQVHEREKEKGVQYVIRGELTTNIGNLSLYKTMADKPSCVFDYLPGKTLEHDYQIDNKIRIDSIVHKNISKTPPRPFDTSSAIQSIGGSPKRVMQILQTLFERGLITYHRTTSKHLSESFCLKIQPAYKPDKDIIVDGAHEAIRPVDPDRCMIPDDPDNPGLSKAYKVIWEHAIGSLYDSWEGQQKIIQFSGGWKYTTEKTLDVKNNWMKRVNREISKSYPDNVCSLVVDDHVFIESGWIRISHESVGKGITENGMVKLLEKSGIGRPSTYATIVNNLSARGLAGYMQRPRDIIQHLKIKSRGITAKLEYLLMDTKTDEHTEFHSDTDDVCKNTSQVYHITDVGTKCLDAIYSSNFKDFFEVSYTSSMESILDSIADGSGGSWEDFVIRIDKTIQHAENTIDKDNIRENTRKGAFPDTEIGFHEGMRYGKGRTRYGPVVWRENTSDKVNSKGYKPRKYNKILAKKWEGIQLKDVICMRW